MRAKVVSLKGISLAVLVTTLAGCQGMYTGTGTTVSQTDASPGFGAQRHAEAPTPAQIFADLHERRLQHSPQMATSLGDPRGMDRWDGPTLAHAQTSALITIQAFERLQQHHDFDALSRQDQISWMVLQNEAENAKRNLPYLQHSYLFNQMFGVQTSGPSFLINAHKINTAKDAWAYVRRLQTWDEQLDGFLARTYQAAEAGIYPPKFTYDYVIRDSRNLVTGAPFDGGADNAIWDDFKTKLAKTNIAPEEQERLKAAAKQALLRDIRPAYQRVIAAMQDLKTYAPGDHGVWALPDGEDYYKARLMFRTSTDLSAEEIHQIGLDEMDRIHNEMREIVKKVNFDGSLREFFQFTREDERFTYPQTPEGREAYLAASKAAIDGMRKKLPEQFGRLPKAELVVKPVEAFREQSAGRAFYNRPAPDGSRPGTYYVNLYNLKAVPKYEIEALAYHEGLPGHHMQIALAMEAEGIPEFRKHSWQTAYGEGWALYTEYLGKEMGFYQDPYSDYGRLTMELWRAARLVVDTGLHAKRWTRQQAIDYLIENTPADVREAERAINRYMVMPGQATAYKIGMIKIQELRAKAKSELGSAYDQRAFHDVILENGPVPLDVLERIVDQWIAQRKAA